MKTNQSDWPSELRPMPNVTHPDVIRRILYLLDNGQGIREIERETGVNRNTVMGIANRRKNLRSNTVTILNFLQLHPEGLTIQKIAKAKKIGYSNVSASLVCHPDHFKFDFEKGLWKTIRQEPEEKLCGWTSSGRLPDKAVLTMWDNGVMHEHALDESAILLLIRTLLRMLPVGFKVNFEELSGDLKAHVEKPASSLPEQKEPQT